MPKPKNKGGRPSKWTPEVAPSSRGCPRGYVLPMACPEAIRRQCVQLGRWLAAWQW
jgi:hypothetical protein